jgi:hypothetical protein
MRTRSYSNWGVSLGNRACAERSMVELLSLVNADITALAGWSQENPLNPVISRPSYRSQEESGRGSWLDVLQREGRLVHVQSMVIILKNMLPFRLYLDDCVPGNGPVRVLPGSHRHGRIAESDIPEWRQRVAEVVCTVPRGGALRMRPLLVHASSPAVSPGRRRVLHIEYAAEELPGGLEWRWRVA